MASHNVTIADLDPDTLMPPFGHSENPQRKASIDCCLSEASSFDCTAQYPRPFIDLSKARCPTYLPSQDAALLPHVQPTLQHKAESGISDKVHPNPNPNPNVSLSLSWNSKCRVHSSSKDVGKVKRCHHSRDQLIIRCTKHKPKHKGNCHCPCRCIRQAVNQHRVADVSAVHNEDKDEDKDKDADADNDSIVPAATAKLRNKTQGHCQNKDYRQRIIPTECKATGATEANDKVIKRRKKRRRTHKKDKAHGTAQNGVKKVHKRKTISHADTVSISPYYIIIVARR
jgi:hypothetical protein